MAQERGTRSWDKACAKSMRHGVVACDKCIGQEHRTGVCGNYVSIWGKGMGQWYGTWHGLRAYAKGIGQVHGAQACGK